MKSRLSPEVGRYVLRTVHADLGDNVENERISEVI